MNKIAAPEDSVIFQFDIAVVVSLIVRVISYSWQAGTVTKGRTQIFLCKPKLLHKKTLSI